MPPTSAPEWSVGSGVDRTSARYEPASGPQRAVFVCAHGAGGNMHDDGMRRTAQTLREAGLGVVRYNFFYRERKSGRIDPMPRLQQCVAAVTEHVRRELGAVPIVIGGRSMGGRASSMLAADGFGATALLLLAYPLHPAGNPEKMRDAHLPAIRMPVLCINGTRDALCQRPLMDAVVGRLQGNWTMHWIDTADHSFHVLKSTGRTDADAFAEIGATARQWLERIL